LTTRRSCWAITRPHRAQTYQPVTHSSGVGQTSFLAASP
jgi:hypothetical protein